MASTLYRPNLTADQRDQLLALVEKDLNGVEWQDPRFDPLYRLVLKLRDCKPFKS